MTRSPNRADPAWDNELALSRIEALGLDLGQRAGSLSGGERAQLALTVAIAKRPELLVLDEPVSSLDPLARREFLQALMGVVSQDNVSVVLSSHLVADLERVCDYLIVLASSRVQVAGEVDDLLATHHRLIGPRRAERSLPANQLVIEADHTDKQSTLLVRAEDPILDPAWTVEPVSVEESLHWLRDTLYQEDKSTVRTRSGPRIMAALRNLAIGALHLAGRHDTTEATRWASRYIDGHSPFSDSHHDLGTAVGNYVAILGYRFAAVAGADEHRPTAARCSWSAGRPRNGPALVTTPGRCSSARPTPHA